MSGRSEWGEEHTAPCAQRRGWVRVHDAEPCRWRRSRRGGRVVRGWRDGAIYEETGVERQREQELMESGACTDSLTPNQGSYTRDSHEHLETFRFTVASTKENKR
jgi:hypothetical protein